MSWIKNWWSRLWSKRWAVVSYHCETGRWSITDCSDHWSAGLVLCELLEEESLVPSGWEHERMPWGEVPAWLASFTTHTTRRNERGDEPWSTASH